MTRRALLTVPVILSMSLGSSAAAQNVPKDLTEAMRLRDEAIAKKDVATWERFTTPDFSVVIPNGRRMNKAERSAQLSSQSPEPIYTLKKVEIRMYGNVAIRQALDPDDIWFIDVWVKDAAGWRVAASQDTPSAKK